MDDKKKSKKGAEKLTIADIKTEDDRSRALQRALDGIEKQFGKGAVMKMGENANTNVQVVPTGSISIDVALGVGGLPRGRIIEIFGPEASGKTTVALHCVAEVQKRGGICGYIDAEHALDPNYAKNIGVNIDELYISQPDDGEQALEIAEAMVRSCAIDLVIVDSVAALTPRAEIEGLMGDSHMGLQARLMSQALRKLTGIAKKTNCTIIFINQLREKIGASYGPSETTTGGRALKFYASVRIDIRRSDWIKSGDDFVGSRTKIKIAKNKVAPPFKICEIDIVYGKGISRIGDILDLSVESKVAAKSGSWFSFGSTRLGQGRENAKSYLEDHPEICEQMEDEVRRHFGLPDMASLNSSIRFLTLSDEELEEETAPKTVVKLKETEKSAKDANATELAEAPDTYPMDDFEDLQFED